MTEAEWLAACDPDPMLKFLHGKACEQLLRLFIAGCCRRNWHLIQDERCRKAIETAERSAEGDLDDEELKQAYVEISQVWTSAMRQVRTDAGLPTMTRAALIADSCRRAVRPSGRITSRIVDMAAADLARVVANGTDSESEVEAFLDAVRPAWEAERRIQVDLLRDIFGNPFQPTTLAPTCRTPTVVSLAQGAYDERHMPSGELDPHRLAVLADALEEVGAPGELMAHLRSPGPHVRGCHAVDLCLGRT